MRVDFDSGRLAEKTASSGSARIYSWPPRHEAHGPFDDAIAAQQQLGGDFRLDVEAVGQQGGAQGQAEGMVGRGLNLQANAGLASAPKARAAATVLRTIARADRVSRSIK